MAQLVIPDISEFQPGINHSALATGLRAQCGAAVVVCRVNYGTGHVDAEIDRNIAGLRAARVDALGLYCYLVAGQDPVAQAETFARVVLAHGGLRPDEFVVCDDEEGAGDQSGRVDAFLDRCDASLRESAGQDAWYSGLSFSTAHNLPAARGRRWIAAYGAPEPSAPHDMWQFTDRQSFAGIAGPCDASVFHGSIGDFLTLIGSTAGGPDMPLPQGLKIGLAHIAIKAVYQREPSEQEEMDFANTLTADGGNLNDLVQNLAGNLGHSDEARIQSETLAAEVDALRTGALVPGDTSAYVTHAELAAALEAAAKQA